MEVTEKEENVKGAGCEDFNNEKNCPKDGEQVEEENDAATEENEVTQQNINTRENKDTEVTQNECDLETKENVQDVG